MQLHALLSLPTFREFRLIAGADGLQREVGNVDILEYEGFTQNYAVFSENDFVLTSLFFAKDDPARILPSVQQLHARGICALAVKTVFYDTLPDEVIAFCEKNGLLVLYSLAETELTQPATAIAKLLRSYDWSAADFTIGVSTCQPTHSSLHQIIRESMDANLLAQYQQTDILLYADLGIYRQLLPLSRVPAAARSRHRDPARLRQPLLLQPPRYPARLRLEPRRNLPHRPAALPAPEHHPLPHRQSQGTPRPPPRPRRLLRADLQPPAHLPAAAGRNTSRGSLHQMIPDHIKVSRYILRILEKLR